MSEVEQFFREQQIRMNYPDEDFDVYLATRMSGRDKQGNSLANFVSEDSASSATTERGLNDPAVCPHPSGAQHKLDAKASHNRPSDADDEPLNMLRMSENRVGSEPSPRKKRRIDYHDQPSPQDQQCQEQVCKESVHSFARSRSEHRSTDVLAPTWYDNIEDNRVTALGQTAVASTVVRDITAIGIAIKEHAHQCPAGDASDETSAAAQEVFSAESMEDLAEDHRRKSHTSNAVRRFDSDAIDSLKLIQGNRGPQNGPSRQAHGKKPTARNSPPDITGGNGHSVNLGDTIQISTPANKSASTSAAKHRKASGGPNKAGTAAARRIAAQEAKKRKKELIPPKDYARRLMEGEIKVRQLVPFLKGRKIFYYGGDLNYAGAQTKGRMNIIVKHGGTLVPVFDPVEVTHIVTEAPKELLLRVLELRDIAEIPESIPIVKWSWVVSAMDRCRTHRPATTTKKGKEGGTSYSAANVGGEEDRDSQEVCMDYEYLHATYIERVDAGNVPWRINPVHEKQQSGRPIKGGKQGAVAGSGRQLVGESSQSSGEVSRISEFSQHPVVPEEFTPRLGEISEIFPPSPYPTTPFLDETLPSPKASISTRANLGAGRLSPKDPLAEFYGQARAERESELLLAREEDAHSGDESTDKHGDGRQRGTHEAIAKGVFLCDNNDVRRGDRCANQDVIDKIEQLMELHKAKPSTEDHWRVFSYGKAIRALRGYPTRIRSYDEARAIRGIGDKTAQKIMEIIETGDLRRIDYENTADVEVINLFRGVYGVGIDTAFKWYASGCRTLEDLAVGAHGVTLSDVQRTGLKYYADINSRMPRQEAEDIYNMIRPIALGIDPKLVVEIMGSFRRGKADCGDIDILITRPTDDGKTHAGVLRRLLRELHRRAIITEDLARPDDFEDLELVYRGLCRRDIKSSRRRIDILTVPYKSRGAALLYFTGDDIFNRSLRLKANVMGYSLNQRGLYAGVIRNPSDRRQKLDDGYVIASESEREILSILGVPWQEPHERVRS